MLALPLVALLLLRAYQVTSTDCCVEDQFSIGLAATWVENSSPLGWAFRLRVKGDASMDYTDHRYALNLEWYQYNDRTTSKAKYIFLYNEETVYTIFNDTQCFKQPLLGQEPFQCLPDDAKIDDSVFVGKSSLQLDSWNISPYEIGLFQGDLRLATTRENCIPVGASLIGTFEPVPGEYDRLVLEAFFFNYTTGLPPSPFVVPEICKYSSQKVKAERLKMLEKLNILRKRMVFF